MPGITLIDLHQPAAGLMSNYLATLPDYKKKLYRDELDAARDAGVDALVAVFHPDHRELCAHEAEYPFKIMNVLEIVGASMGLRRDDHYKRLKLLQEPMHRRRLRRPRDAPRPRSGHQPQGD